MCMCMCMCMCGTTNLLYVHVESICCIFVSWYLYAVHLCFYHVEYMYCLHMCFTFVFIDVLYLRDCCTVVLLYGLCIYMCACMSCGIKWRKVLDMYVASVCCIILQCCGMFCVTAMLNIYVFMYVLYACVVVSIVVKYVEWITIAYGKCVLYYCVVVFFVTHFTLYLWVSWIPCT
jgi:hypothetical protein